MTSKKYYKILNDFSHTESDLETKSKYLNVFKAILNYNFGIKKKSLIKNMFENLCYGNWKHLWKTEEEELRTESEWCDELRGEVLYCSDRVSWDRLIRIHWIWQRIGDLHVAKGEAWKWIK